VCNRIVGKFPSPFAVFPSLLKEIGGYVPKKAEKQVEKREKLISSNEHAEKRREEQIRRSNQSKDINENEMRSSQATIQVQNS
jgi:hypothetical protein